MKLITEYNESIEYKTLIEGTEKKFFIEGIFMQSEQKNKNGRIYKKPTLEKAVNEYIKNYVNTGRAVGELSHPPTPTINLDKVSHRILELKWNGNDVIGKALILNTPMGNIVKGMIEGGVKLGVSSRGMGSLESVNGVSYVADDYVLNTVDIVQDPSAPGAFINGIMEGVDWCYQNGIFTARQVEKYETEIKKLDSYRIRAFSDLLSSLKL